MVFILIGLLLKGGVAPLHQWFPSVSLNVSWFINLVLMTWQKVAPLFILGKLFLSFHFSFILVGIINLVFGVVGALGHVQLRGVFSYASIAHMG